MYQVDAPLNEPGRIGQLWLDLAVRWKGLIIVSIPIVALIPFFFGSLVIAIREPQIRAASRSVTAAQVANAQLLQLVIDAETGMRGFAASGDDGFLAPYASARRSLPSVRTELQTYADSNPDLATVIERNLSAAESGMTELGALQYLLSVDTLSAEERTDKLFAAKTVMDRARITSSVAADRLAEKLVSERAELDRLQQIARQLLAVGLVLGLCGSFIGGLLLTRGISRRLEALAKNADRFAQGEPMVPVVRSRDEIGALEDRLESIAIVLTVNAQQMRSSRDEALGATRAKDEFLSRMSHELRTPLTAILGFGQLLQMEELTPDDRESVDHIVSAGRHLLDLINEVLDVARIESGNLSLSLEPISLNDVVSETVSLLGPMAAARGITITHDIVDDTAVIADRQRLKQVVLNLVANAIKYNHEDGRIDVTMRPEGDCVRVSVHDTGVGIPADQIDRLFTPFERLDAVNTDIEGTGVGLALTKGLVTAMNGTIGVHSDPPNGSTFWFELAKSEPFVLPDLADFDGSTVAVPRPGSTVLYVEDNLANVRLVERIFRNRPERLEVAMQGAMAVTLAQRLRPDLVLLDLHLPDFDGEEVFEALKANPATASIPVAVLSADATPRRIERLMDHGAAAYLSKPIDVEAILSLLDRIARSNTA